MVKDNGRDVFLAIDANAIIHRAFHAYPSSLQTAEGVQVNAVYGFTVMLLESLKIFGPKYVLCAMDTHAPTFRHEVYTEYKATRKPTDLSLIDQFPLVEEILKAFNIPLIKKDGYEADDILGTISSYVANGVWSSENVDLYILSGDRDLLQLIGNNIYVCLPNGSFRNIEVYDRDFTFQKYGYYPEQVVDYKAMVGDPSDNIPGVKGIGHKTAVDLLQRFNNLEGIYRNINEIGGRSQKLLTEGVEQAEFSKQLATIEKDVGLDIYLTDCLLKDLDRKLLNFTFKKYAFKSLVGRLDDIFGKHFTEPNISQLDMFKGSNQDFKWSPIEDLKDLIKQSQKLKVVYVNQDESYDTTPYIFVGGVMRNGAMKELVTRELHILSLLEGKEVVFYNFEELVTHNEDISIGIVKTFYDVLLAEHLTHSERRNLTIKDLAFYYSNKILDEKLSPMQSSEVIDVLDDTHLAQLSKLDSLELYEYTKKSIKRFLDISEDYLLNVLREIELPLSIVLSHMESRGIQLDWEKVQILSKDIEKEIESTTEEIYSIVGHEFNINSPKQLSDILFNELKLPKSAKGSTRESVLRKMLGMHPLIEHLLYFREISKIKSTYVEPLYSNSVKKGNKYSIHTDFKQTGTSSGRFSSINPNMQNLPLEGAWAKRVRECFVAREGFKLLGMDYSQMELRIMADISNDKLLIQDFLNGRDIHSATAARVLKKKLTDITHRERSIGKTVNFGMIFGQTAFGLSSLLGIDRDTAKEYISAYFNNYSGIENYMRSIEYEAFEKGYVQTMFGTTRNITGIRSKNRRLQAASAREAINMPIQGSEADIMKLVMRNIYSLIQDKYSKKAYILLQIHDEIVFEVNEKLIEEFGTEIERLMLESVQLEVPFEVHKSIGNSLSDLK